MPKTATRVLAAAGALALLAVLPAFSQAPPPLPPGELDRLVDRIALYPDPLLSQVLAAATYSDQIPDAARWADQHHYLTGQTLANAIQEDHLPWDPSVQALLPFPSVLDMLASDMNWTRRLGDAFLTQQAEVMDAVQRERRRARDYGYLRSGGGIVVGAGPYITILPANPAFIPVPYYDPGIVFFAPRPGFFVGGAIRFGFGVTIGGFFRPWGWGYNNFDWGRHVVIINNAPWRRTWVTRREYMHPYEVRRYQGPRYEERHELHERSERERESMRRGGEYREEHDRR
jgi:Protein of unknown function (DUF3300)